MYEHGSFVGHHCRYYISLGDILSRRYQCHDYAAAPLGATESYVTSKLHHGWCTHRSVTAAMGRILPSATANFNTDEHCIDQSFQVSVTHRRVTAGMEPRLLIGKKWCEVLLDRDCHVVGWSNASVIDVNLTISVDNLRASFKHGSIAESHPARHQVVPSSSCRCDDSFWYGAISSPRNRRRPNVIIISLPPLVNASHLRPNEHVLVQ